MSVWTDSEARDLDPEHYTDPTWVERANNAVVNAIYDALIGVNNAELTLELTLPSGRVVQWSSVTDKCVTTKVDRAKLVSTLNELGLVDDLALEITEEDIKAIMGGSDE